MSDLYPDWYLETAAGVAALPRISKETEVSGVLSVNDYDLSRITLTGAPHIILNLTLKTVQLFLAFQIETCMTKYMYLYTI